MAQQQDLPEELQPAVVAGTKISIGDYETDSDGRVTKLILNGCEITDISWIARMKELSELDLARNRISDIQPISSLKNLWKLDLSLNQIDNLAALSTLTNLSSLYLSGNRIDRLQPLIGLNNLTHLQLSSNEITDITPLQSLTNLERLDLNLNQISDLNPLQNLSRLTVLDLDYNNIADLKPLKRLRRLTLLYISNNDITDISSLSDFQDFSVLDLSSNRISDIKPLTHLNMLRVLYLSKNQIADLKPLAKLTNLTDLYLNDNSIQSLTPLRHLTNLKFIEINRNPCTSLIPSETLSSGWTAIQEWLSTEGDHELIYEAKMLLLGNPNVGKSDLLYYLKKNKPKPQDEEREPTHGLVYKELNTIKKDWKIHCWDFGGQEFYHATHQLFFSPGALHLLLWSAKDVQRKEEDHETCYNPDYWLRCIEQLSQGEGKVETIAIENKIDLQLNDEEKTKQRNTYRLLNREEQTKEYNTLELHTTKMSLEESKRTEGLKELIRERLATLFRPHPPKYTAFLKKINASQKDVMTIAEIADKEDHNYVKTAMTVLHKIGCLLYFKDAIPEKVFVKPAALLDLLYERILNKEKASSTTLEKLEEVTKDNKLGLSANEIVELLLSFHLIFNIPSEKNKYYIPQYLPGEPSWMEFMERLHFKKSYIRVTSDNFIMHDALLRIFTKYGEYIKPGENQNPLFWKDGLVIQKNGQVLLIKFNRHAQCIELFNDLENANFQLQMEVTEFIVSLKTDNNEKGRHAKEELTGEGKTEYEKGEKLKTEVRQSRYFKVLLSADGVHFASLKDVANKIDDKQYFIEAIADNGSKKVVSVYSFNKYLGDKQEKMKKIFISYSKKDLALVNTFISHLEPLKRDGKVATWYCTDLQPGSDWHAEIKDHFYEADIVCFMVSPAFLNTPYILEYEIKEAIKRKEQNNNFMIVPIILDFCMWEADKYQLSKYNALPYAAKEIMSFKNQNMAWYAVAECLRIAIDDNKQFTSQTEGDEYFAASKKSSKLLDIFKQIQQGSA